MKLDSKDFIDRIRKTAYNSNVKKVKNFKQIMKG